VRATRYTTLSPAALADEFSTIAGDAASVFGRYDATQLNWQPHAASWSIAQCFDHLLKADHAMFRAIGMALDRGATPTVWQRLPLWPRLFGWVLVTSQAPGGRQRYTAPPSAQPASSDIPPDTIERFIACQHTALARVRDLGAEDARRIMVSPFVSRITYCVLDGYRLIAAHQRRHFAQAQRVTEHPDFPVVR
jgi:DinB superfamily